MDKWEELLNIADHHRTQSDLYLNMAVQEIARQKGFTEDQVKNFGAAWSSGGEAIVTYDKRGEMADLDIRFMPGYTKEEIIKRLSEYEENLFEV